MRLLIYHKKECNPKKCTALKLEKFGFVELFYTLKMIPKNTILLSPHSDKALSRKDSKFSSITALDCSWKNTLQAFKKVKGIPRILPYLIAANDVNYGKPTKLSTAESLASSLYILGKKQKALNIVEKFSWCKAFMDLNLEMLEAYSHAKDSKEIIEIQKQFMEAIK